MKKSIFANLLVTSLLKERLQYNFDPSKFKCLKGVYFYSIILALKLSLAIKKIILYFSVDVEFLFLQLLKLSINAKVYLKSWKKHTKKLTIRTLKKCKRKLT